MSMTTDPVLAMGEALGQHSGLRVHTRSCAEHILGLLEVQGFRVVRAFEGTRVVLVEERVITEFRARTEQGDLITAEWGEPNPDGTHAPTFTAHHDDNPLRDMTDAFAKFLFALGYPYDMQVHDPDGQPVLPPLPVLDRLVELWQEADAGRGATETVENYRWSFAQELGADPWGEQR